MKTMRMHFLPINPLEFQAQPLPQWMAGVLVEEEMLRIIQTSNGHEEYELFCDDGLRKHIPKGALVQLMDLESTSSGFSAGAALYFLPADHYTQLFRYGNCPPDAAWKALSPFMLQPDPVIFWPLWAEAETDSSRKADAGKAGGEAEKDEADLNDDPDRLIHAVLESPDSSPELPKDPDPVTAHAPEMPSETPPKEEDFSDLLRKSRLKTMMQMPGVRKAMDFIQENASRDPEPAPSNALPGELPQRLKSDQLKMLLEEYQDCYSPELVAELQGLLSSGNPGDKLAHRILLMLRYCYTRKPRYQPIPVDALQEKLTRALPGHDELIRWLVCRCENANAARQPLHLLLLDLERSASETVVSCFVSVMQGAEINANDGVFSLQGIDMSYSTGASTGTCGSIVKALEAPLVGFQNLSAGFPEKDSDRDNPAQSLRELFLRGTFTDQFIFWPVHYYGHIIAQSAELRAEERNLFRDVLEIPLHSTGEKIRMLQARAQRGEPAFSLTDEAARLLVEDYAPGSLARAERYLEQMRPRVTGSIRPEDLSRLLGEPALTDDERLVVEYYHSRDGLPAETRHSADRIAAELLSLHRPDSWEGEREQKLRTLRELTDLQQAARPCPPPDPGQVRKTLDRELEGMEDLKELMVLNVCDGQRRPILLCGAPGTGKTALGRALAHSLGAQLVRINMGALEHRGDLTGIKKPYTNAGSGLLVQSILRKKSRCVLLFDEVDKARTEVADVLLELLEKEHLFEDGFLGRLDLSQHIILLSANRLDTISRPLLDRCRVVEVKPYSPRQKERLLRRMWLATACREGVAQDLPGETAAEILRHCRTGGARDLETACVRLAEHLRSGHSMPRTREEVSALFGAATLEQPPITQPGITYILAATGDGGGLVSRVVVSSGQPGVPLRLLGMGETTMNESVELAVTLAAALLGQAKAPALTVAMDSSKKSGPSAGLAICLAVWSKLTGLTLSGVAATGELFLNGEVLPVGGVEEKLAACIRGRSVVQTVLMPAACRETLSPALRQEAREAGLNLCFVSTVGEAVAAVLAARRPRPAPKKVLRPAAPAKEAALH